MQQDPIRNPRAYKDRYHIIEIYNIMSNKDGPVVERMKRGTSMLDQHHSPATAISINNTSIEFEAIMFNHSKYCALKSYADANINKKKIILHPNTYLYMYSTVSKIG